jgi:DNA-binding transcriptional MerR regulator
MLIGELSKKTKLSRHTIRFYEKLGLIAVPQTSRRGNNYKEYPDDTLRRIEAIQEIKSKGFTLKEAKGILTLAAAGTLDQERGRRYILKKVKNIEKQIEQLEEVKQSLMAWARQCETDECDVRRILEGKPKLC